MSPGWSRNYTVCFKQSPCKRIIYVNRNWYGHTSFRVIALNSYIVCHLVWCSILLAARKGYWCGGVNNILWTRRLSSQLIDCCFHLHPSWYPYCITLDFLWVGSVRSCVFISKKSICVLFHTINWILVCMNSIQSKCVRHFCVGWVHTMQSSMYLNMACMLGIFTYFHWQLQILLLTKANSLKVVFNNFTFAIL